MTELVILALAAWRLTYEIVFGPLCEGLRAKLNIGYDYDAQGFASERWAVGGVGSFVNCHSCVSIITAVLVLAFWWCGIRCVCIALAVMAATSILGRWWMSQRVKREWWL